MALNKKPYKGCRDFLPADMRIRDYFFKKMRSSAELFAYEAYDGPLLEEVSLYKAKSGEELINEQIYSFTDRGERHVAIRPEMTPTVARMVAGVHRQSAKPLRWYSIPNLMRYEKPQRGRVREHWQFNVDIFGAAPNLGEIEVLTLIVQFLTSFGATEEMFSILLNDRRVVDTIFKDILKLEEDEAYKLYKVIDKAKKVSSEKLDIMISEVIKDTERFQIFKRYLTLSNFETLREFLTENNMSESCSEFLDFASMIHELNLGEYIQYDPTIVRGLDYYTGVVFEIFDKHPDNNRAIAGGGAYANLLKIFNEEPLAGVGFGLGDVTLRDFLETHKLLPDLTKADHDLFVVYTDDKNQLDAFEFANKMRGLNIKTELYLGRIKFNKIFKLAESKGHNFIAIIEENDGLTKVQLKNLSSRSGEFFSLEQTTEIQNFIKEL